MDASKVGMGCPSCGGGCTAKASCGCGASTGYGGNGGGWRTADIETVASWSPVIAFARACKTSFVPLTLNIHSTFTDPTVTTLGVASFEGGNERLSVVSVVDRVVFQVDAPAQQEGNTLKPVNDFFFARQSGIAATMNVDGAPKYSVSPFFTPIASLAAMINEAWPMGWVLTFTQSVRMQFTATIALPTLPTTVTFTFRMWQPHDMRFVGMTDRDALSGLSKMGYKWADAMEIC